MVMITVRRAVRVYGVSGRKKMDRYACYTATIRQVAARRAR